MLKLKVSAFVFVIGLLLIAITSCSSSTGTVDSSDKENEITQEQKAPAIPHVLVNRDNCLGCHGETTLLSIPPSHQGRENDSCTSCHEVAANPSSFTYESIPHSIDGRENCLGCHASGTSEGVPSSHQGRTNDTCITCHQPGNTISQEQKVPTIPHLLVNRDNCLGCHGEGTLLSVPSSHQGRENDSCTGCHEVAANPSSYTYESIPHELEGRENCLMCHASGTSEGIPSDHQGRTNDTCVACHQPGGEESDDD